MSSFPLKLDVCTPPTPGCHVFAGPVEALLPPEIREDYLSGINRLNFNIIGLRCHPSGEQMVTVWKASRVEVKILGSEWNVKAPKESWTPGPFKTRLQIALGRQLKMFGKSPSSNASVPPPSPHPPHSSISLSSISHISVLISQISVPYLASLISSLGLHVDMPTPWQVITTSDTPPTSSVATSPAANGKQVPYLISLPHISYLISLPLISHIACLFPPHISYLCAISHISSTPYIISHISAPYLIYLAPISHISYLFPPYLIPLPHISYLISLPHI